MPRHESAASSISTPVRVLKERRHRAPLLDRTAETHQMTFYAVLNSV